jgi:hypothetical protein
MLRGRRAVVAIVLVAALCVGLGLWRRATLLDERTAADAARRRATELTARVRQGVTVARETADAVAAATVSFDRRAQELEQQANLLADRVRELERRRDDAALSTYLTGGELGALRDCLDGVTRALNQVSVNDPAAVGALEAVARACRTVAP